MSQVNAAADQIAALNREIRDALTSGRSANELIDQRNVLAQNVSRLAGGKATVESDGTLTVRIDGNALVSGSDARDLALSGPTSIDGAAVFGTGAGSVFALVDRIIADLRSGTNVGPRLAEIDDRRTAMLSAQGAVGARQNQIERAKEAAVQNSVSLESRRAAVEDVDSVEVLVQLQAQELVYRSALAVNARVLQPSLMDFLQ